MAFAPAARRHSKARLAISGPSGSGKTYTSLQIAKLFSDRVALADSERGSASKYALKAGTKERPGNWRFDVDQVNELNPLGYVQKVRDAAAAGYPVLVIDSYSHSWLGALATVDAIGGNKFTGGWKAVTPQVTKLVDTILRYPGHVIATMRSKGDWVIEEDAKGKKVPRKVGMAPVAREGTEYEFDVMIDLTPEGTITVMKSRCEAIPNGQVFDRDEIPAFVEKLKAWLDEGTPLSPLESLIERIRFVATYADLQALVPEIKALSPEDRATIKATYEARKAELVVQEEEVPA